ncbi:hypothetical protein E2C01_059628 [Portunus trituberculatus]|uniref:Uncharacterized protein n=1 Tax=Portunus trituberculatus TaxID=210409 RepID=A0A5B7H5W4_PORTR|nr:hypothetical protein [Portunus trituberculatus]
MICRHFILNAEHKLLRHKEVNRPQAGGSGRRRGLLVAKSPPPLPPRHATDYSPSPPEPPPQPTQTHTSPCATHHVVASRCLMTSRLLAHHFAAK